MDDSLSGSDFTSTLALLERISGGFETTPLRLSSFVESFCETLGDAVPQWVPVIAMPGAEPGKSANNVAAKIARSGGDVQYGWAIWENPGISISASFHAVWMSPKGDLFDVTPEPYNASRILFVPDERPSPATDITPPTPARITRIRPALGERLHKPE